MTVEKIFSLILPCLSMWGYVHLLCGSIKAEFAIAVTLAFIGSATFLAGIAGVMPLAVDAIIYLGIACLVIALFKRISLKKVITPGTVFFAVMMCVFCYLLYGAYFVEQDNFTHWAFVSKLLINNDRFPLASDPNVWFPSYPLGSASFIYFFCKAFGADSEWFQMLMQAMLMTGMGTAVFAFAKNIKGYILSAVYVIILLCSNIGFNELLVDTLLAMIGFGGIAFCVYYRNDLKHKVWYTIPYMVLLMAVKNSGLFFAAVMIVYCLVYIIKNKNGFGAFASLAISAAAPFASLKLWQNHVRLEFEGGLLSKHSMSIENLEKVFGEKTPEDIKNIVIAFKDAMLSLSNPVLWMLIFILAVVLVNRFALKEQDKFFNGTAIFAVATYLAYQLGQLGMYLFNMPTAAALGLECYDRYTATVLICVCGIVCCGVLGSPLFDKAETKVKNCAALYGVCAVIMLQCLHPNLHYYSRQVIPPERNRAINNMLIEEYNIPLNSGYIIIFDDECEEWVRETYFYEAKYIFGNNAKVRFLRDVKADESLFSKYPWVIMFHQTEPIVEYLESRYGPDLPRVIYTPDYPLVSQ